MTDKEIENFTADAYEWQRDSMGGIGLRPWSELGPLTKQRLIEMTKTYFVNVAKINGNEEPK